MAGRIGQIRDVIASLWNVANEPLDQHYVRDLERRRLAPLTHPELDTPRWLAMARGGLAGAFEGAGNVIDQVTSPIGLVTTLSGMTKGALPAGPTAAAISRGERALTAANVAGAAARATQPDATAGDWVNVALGALPVVVSGAFEAPGEAVKAVKRQTLLPAFQERTTGGTNRFVNPVGRQLATENTARQFKAQLPMPETFREVDLLKAKYPRVMAHARAASSSMFPKRVPQGYSLGGHTAPFEGEVRGTTRSTIEINDPLGLKSEGKGTIGHELLHTAQYWGNKSMQRLYNLAEQITGYRNNPFEIVARRRGDATAAGLTNVRPETLRQAGIEPPMMWDPVRQKEVPYTVRRGLADLVADVGFEYNPYGQMRKLPDTKFMAAWDLYEELLKREMMGKNPDMEQMRPLLGPDAHFTPREAGVRRSK